MPSEIELNSITTTAQTEADRIATITRYNETLASRPNGIFYRYMSYDTLVKLMDSGELVFDSQAAYLSVIDTKYNPASLPDLQFVSYVAATVLLNLTRQHDRNMRDLADVDLINDVNQVQNKLQTLEAELLNKGVITPGFVSAVLQTVQNQDTAPLIAYFKTLKGVQTMIELERRGWDRLPYAAFSDLLPLSVGAPLAASGSSEVVVVEFDLKKDQILIPENDKLNEHEIMVRKIATADITKLYGVAEFKQLWQLLCERFPEHFLGKNSSALRSFATEVTLHELLEKVFPTSTT